MPCHVEPPSYSYEVHVSKMLCRACRLLTPHELKSIRSEDGIYGDLFAFYSGHLEDDRDSNRESGHEDEAKAAEQEFRRIWSSYYHYSGVILQALGPLWHAKVFLFRMLHEKGNTVLVGKEGALMAIADDIGRIANQLHDLFKEESP